MVDDALVSRHKTGFTSELKAAKFYADSGYIIYWPLTHQGPCDFIAVNKDMLVRVQVKSGYWMERPTGQTYLQSTVRKGCGRKEETVTYSKLDCDIIAISYEEELWIFPVEDIKDYTTINLRKGQKLRKSRIDALDVDKYKVL